MSCQLGLLQNLVVFEGDKLLSAVLQPGKTVGLHGFVEKVPGNSRGRKSPLYRVAWMDGNNKIIEDILQTNEFGNPIVCDPVHLLDRDFKIGTTLVNKNGDHGVIIDVDKVATLALETLDKEMNTDINSEMKLQKIPVKMLKRPLDAEIGEKFLWNEWIGRIDDLTVRVIYYFEDSDKICSLKGEGKHSIGNQAHKYPFPFVGEEVSSLSWVQLWDADWEDNQWFRNIFKYLGRKAKVVNVMVDSITPEWITKVQNDNSRCGVERERPDLPTYLVNEDLGKVQYLYGREYNKIEEKSLCKYNVCGDDKISFIRNGSNLQSTVLEYSSIEDNIPILQVNKERIFTVLQIRNEYLVQWRSGAQEFCSVKEEGLSLALQDPSSISLVKPLRRGSIVEKDSCGDSSITNIPENALYGLVLNESQNRLVNVNWVIPVNDSEVQLEERQNSTYDVKLCDKYLFLEDLKSNPVVFVNKFLVGVVTDIDVDGARLHINLPTGLQLFPFVHDVVHVPDPKRKCPYQSPDEENSEEQEEDVDGLTDIIDLEQFPFNPKVNKSGYFISAEVSEENTFYDMKFIPRMSEFKYLKALEKEIASFKDLPKGMWIQGFEVRSDLFTCILCGNSGTPYQDSLLVFDIALPHDFPSAVPEIILRSYGLEINPKIRTTGEVILPTYSDLIPLPSINENPCIIRTALSWIQNELLCKDPYYLVCQNGKSSGDNFAEAHNRCYNEHIILNLLTYHKNVVNQFPKNWESFFEKYYRDNLPKMVHHYESLLLRGGFPAEINAYEKGDSTPDFDADGFYVSLRSRLDGIRATPYLN